MEKKNLLVRALVPVVLAGLVFVGFSACSQDDGYPEGFVLNDETGAATLAKRSMPQGGESTKPIEPSLEHDDAEMVLKCVSVVSEGDGVPTEISVVIHYTYKRVNGKPTSPECSYYMTPDGSTIEGLTIGDLTLHEDNVPGHYMLECTATIQAWNYVGEAEVLL